MISALEIIILKGRNTQWQRQFLKKWAHLYTDWRLSYPQSETARRRNAIYRHLGQRRLRYLKECRRVVYFNLLTSGKLNSYLADIDEQAENMFLRLIKQMAGCEGVTEQLKADNQLEWVQKMNNIRNRAIEIINNDLIYA